MSNLTDRVVAKAHAFQANLKAAASEEKDELLKSVQVAKEKVQQSKAAIDQEVAFNSLQVHQGLDRIKEKIQEKKAEIHNKVTETEADFKLKKAESEAKAAEDYAEQVLSLAFYYFDEAEVAAIDAILSRRTVDSLKD